MTSKYFDLSLSVVVPEIPILDEGRVAQIRELQRPGEVDLYCQLIPVFKGFAKEGLSHLRVCVSAGDRNAISRAAHSLKSCAANLGGERMAHACYKLETSARDADMLRIFETAAEIQTEFEAFEAAIGEFLEVEEALYGT